MTTTAPTRGRVLTMVLFGASCISLLIYLWTSFGGTIPLAPAGYRFSVEFDQAIELGVESDVRISGVNVGKVVSVGLDRRTELTRAVIEIDPGFAPRPADTRAILRQKSVLGETYVELSPGSRTARKLPDGASLPRARVAPTVQPDQILSTLDPGTRRAFQTWVQQSGVALTGRGEDVNAALAQLYPFAANVDSVLAVLRRQGAATSTLLRDGTRVLSGISRSPTQLQGLIRNADEVFSATADRNAALAATVKALPAFLSQGRSAIARITSFAVDAKPLIDELLPAARQLSPTLQSLTALAPELRDLLVNIGPLTSASKAGFPALEHFLNQSEPFLARVKPYLGGVVPVIDYLNSYRGEIAGFFANSTAATEGTLPSSGGGKLRHYVRTSNPVNVETLAPFQTRLSTNRGNAYAAPGSYERLLQGLEVFGSYLCTSNQVPAIGPSIPANLVAVLKRVYYTSDPSGPPCKAQSPLGAVTGGQLQSFPDLTPLR